MNWQPIETAPKDRLLMLYVPETTQWGPRPWIGMWSYTNGDWSIDTPFVVNKKSLCACGLEKQPTHWQPLPPPPTKEAA